MTLQPLVSIIIPTRDCAEMLRRCLVGVQKQTYSSIEVIVVDGNSIDNTRDVAREFTDKVFTFSRKGDHRCAQRNLGVEKSSGKYVLVIDSDMELSEKVVECCVEKIEFDEKMKGIIVPEESFGEGFWAQCKKLEKSFYVGVSWMEAARFFTRTAFDGVGGYDETMISGEDWDLSQRIEKTGRIGRIDDLIYHNEGRINLLKTVKKKYYYAQEFAKYTEKQKSVSANVQHQTGVVARYRLFFSQPKKLFRNPVIGLGVLFMKTCEFGFGWMGYLNRHIRPERKGVKILLLGTHGQNNIGDELLLETFLFQLRKINKVFFCVNSYKPQQTARYFNVKSFHTLKEKHKLLKCIFYFDYVLFAGGSIIKEMYSSYGRSTYSVMNMLMLLVGFSKKIAWKKIILSNIGIGPIDTSKGFAKARFILKNSNIISVRDNISKNYGERAYREAKIRVVPDAVFSLDRTYFGLTQVKERDISDIKDVSIVVFNLCRNISRPEVWEKFIDEMVAVFAMIYDINPLVKIVGLPMQVDYSCDDHKTLQSFGERLRSRIPEINFEIASPRDPEAVAKIIDGCDLLIAERLHCAILATIINTPFIALEYDIKVKSYLTDINMEKNGIDISETFQAGEVFEKIETIVRNYYSQKVYLESVAKEKNILANEYFADLRTMISNKI